ncbi:MAG: DNA-binding protein [Nitrososphaeria archaeon]|nr:DNA-binding protein [Nitrososphaeria archaeon]
MYNGFVYRFGIPGRILVARLKTGSDLLLSLKEIVEKNGISAGVILSGVGLLEKACIRNVKVIPERFPILDEHRIIVSFNGPLEILSLSGNISLTENKPSLHVHATLSYYNGASIKVVGGHVIEGCKIFSFAEIIIMEIDNILMKKGFDVETKTLQLFA